ncbi:hypothetical protein V6N13_148825 [Hibiscus sabdariffa]
MVSCLNSNCQAGERAVLTYLNLVNLVDCQVDFESLPVEPKEVGSMDARFIVSVEPLKDTHSSRNLLDCVIPVQSKRKKGKGNGKDVGGVEFKLHYNRDMMVECYFIMVANVVRFCKALVVLSLLALMR